MTKCKCIYIYTPISCKQKYTRTYIYIYIYIYIHIFIYIFKKNSPEKGHFLSRKKKVRCSSPLLCLCVHVPAWEYNPLNLPLPPPLLDLLPISTPSSLDLVSHYAHHLWRGLAAGLPIPSSVGIESGGYLDSDFSLRGPASVSVLRPNGSTMASSSLVSTRACQSSNATGFLLPSSSTSVLCHSGPAAVFRSPAYTSVAKASGSTLALHIFGLTLAFSSLSPPWAPPPPALPPLVSPMESAVTPPWLLSPSTPPWTFMMFCVWFVRSLAPLPPPEPSPTLLSWMFTARGRTFPGEGELLYVCLSCDLVFPVLFN